MADPLQCDPLAYIGRLSDSELKLWVDSHRDEDYAVPSREEVEAIVAARG